MNGYFVLDARGEPIEEKDFTIWTWWFEQADRSVARTDVAPQVTVLTTFSGFDPNANGGAPRLFETRVLGGVLDGEEARHASKAEALRAPCRTRRLVPGRRLRELRRQVRRDRVAPHLLLSASSFQPVQASTLAVS